MQSVRSMIQLGPLQNHGPGQTACDRAGARPLGVIGIVYESRPNVTADAGVLCLKSGNAAILQGGSDSMRSSRAIVAAMTEGLRAAGLPEASIQLVPTRDRAAVGQMLAGLDGNIDVVVPRGGKSLVARVQSEARVPVFAHLEGVCHVYVHKAAALEMAKKIVLNAKMRRTGVCGAAETLLVDRDCAAIHLKPLIEMLIDAGCEIRGDKATVAVDKRVKAATEEDWEPNISTPSLPQRWSTGFPQRSSTSSVMDRTTRTRSCRRPCRRGKFLREVDSAIVLHNASPNSPMAANSASARRSALPPAGCMRVGPSVSISSPRSVPHPRRWPTRP